MARILIGNLSLEIADSLKRILEEGKNELSFTGTDEEIITHLQNDSCDLIILDVINPEKRIHHLVEHVKSIDEFLPILLVGGLPLNPSVFDAKYPPGNVFLATSLEIDDVQFVIKKALAYRQMQISYKNIKAWVQEYEKEKSIFEYKPDDLVVAFQVSKEISCRMEKEALYKQIITRLARVLEVKTAAFLSFNEEKEELVHMAGVGMSLEEVTGTRLKAGEALAGYVLQQEQAVSTEDVNQDSRFQNRTQEKFYSGSFMSAPLLWGGKVIGVINACQKKEGQIFTPQDLQLLKGLAVEAVMMIQLVDFYLTLEELYLKMVLILNTVIEEKDFYTKEHCQRTQYYAEAIAKEMGLPDGEVNEIKQACQLQDIGNIRVPDYILTKPGTLTPEEWDTMKSHVDRATDILRPLSFLNPVNNIISQHHERVDGKGYPHHLQGEDIAIGSRIMRVADSVAAMTTERPYRPVMSKEETAEELEKNKGVQFDAGVVDSFMRVAQKHPGVI